MLEKVGRKYRSYDKFTVGKPQMKVDFEGAGPAYKSYMGATVSIIFIVISAIFLFSKILILVNNSHIMITSKLLEDVIQQNEHFSHTDGLFVSAALTEYNDSTEPIEDLTYGELIISHYGWNANEHGIGSYNRQLETEACSDEQLGLEHSEYADKHDYPIYEKSRAEVQQWRRKFKCLSQVEDYTIWGDYNSNTAQ